MGREDTVARDESARTRLTSDLVLMFEPSVNTDHNTHTNTHTVHMIDWSGIMTESTAVDRNREDGTGALWPSAAVPFDGREETEGRSRRQVVTQLVLHHRLLRQGEEETADSMTMLSFDQPNNSRAAAAAAALRGLCLRISHGIWRHAAPFQNDTVIYTQLRGQKWASSVADTTLNTMRLIEENNNTQCQTCQNLKDEKAYSNLQC